MVILLPKTLAHLSPVTHSSVLVARPIVALVLCPVAGILVDKTSWWFGMVIASGCYVVSCTLVIIQVSTHHMPLGFASLYLSSRLVEGFASSLFFPASVGGLVKTHDDFTRARAVGLAFLGEAGGLAGPAIGGVLYDYGGSKLAWSVCLIASVISVLVVAVLGYCGLPPPTPRPARDEAGRPRGQSVDLPLPASVDQQEESPPDGDASQAGEGYYLLTYPSFLTILLSLASGWMGASACTALLPLLWSKKYQLSASRMGELFVPMLVLKAVSGPSAGYLVDRCGVRPLLLIGMMVLWCAGTLVWLGSTLGAAALPASQVAALSIYGVPFGALDTITTAAAGQWMDEQVVVRGEGKAFAIMGQFFNLGLLFGPAIAASLIQIAHFRYDLAFETIGALFIPLAGLVFWCDWSRPIRAHITRRPVYRTKTI
ncbi:unnamed protein product [Vitrella brassicaformis CCMP3155]|uniref:Major facilitator superfamily (MFS) profile domain-containing protein n=1 Tax=Vitrella brassicaformis (strain CCMP3155) TaxID=1169540 RepID=A0A0G4G8Y7_VITBC|nr:unnamed protein product [Vitrella brassicaformis CCMP3155]|eukprot:CEM25183.1 unnamed protein product [Vitrella brassicaformis CCMP3155]